MKTPLALLSALLLLPQLALAADAPPARVVESDVALSGATAVEANLPIGNLFVKGTGGERVKARLEVTCSADPDCPAAAQKLAVTSRNRAGELLVQVEGYPKLGNKGLSLVLHLEIPRAVRLETNLGVGDARVEGINGDLEVGIGVGNVSLKLDQGKVKSVELDSGVGEVALLIDGGRIEGSGLVGKGLEWSQGKGTAHVEVDTGVGDITVELD
jgi:hypothetical protein